MSSPDVSRLKSALTKKPAQFAHVLAELQQDVFETFGIGRIGVSVAMSLEPEEYGRLLLEGELEVELCQLQVIHRQFGMRTTLRRPDFILIELPVCGVQHVIG